MFNLKCILCYIIVLSILKFGKVLGENTLKRELMLSRELFMPRPITLGVRQEVDEELCELQNSLTESSLVFTDASGKLPSGILVGNLNHFGHYEQCLSIDETVGDVHIRGKYCMMNVQISGDANFILPNGLSPALPPGMSISGLMAVCVPDACPASMDNILPGIELQSELFFCRMANDKPLATQDIVAIVLFSILGLFVIACTSYQLYNKISYCKDVPKIAKTFSAYHQMEKLTTYPKNENSLSSINGIRVLSTLWIILGHTYTSTQHGTVTNPLTLWQFVESFGITWILGGNLAVDTFFYLAAFLLTWSTLKKLNEKETYAKSVPIIYLNRYLRLTPLLAAVMLLQMSFFNHVSDGPYWEAVDWGMHNCVEGWWVNMIYLQNYLRPSSMCLPQSWYLAFDMQLNLAAPIVIMFLFGGLKIAICALIAFCILALGTVLGYHFVYNTVTPLTLMQEPTTNTFWDRLFENTTRCTSQFLFGIILAYVMFQLKKRNISITNKLYMFAHWIITAALLILPFYGLYSTGKEGVSRSTLIFFDAWHKPAWVLGVGGVIVACMHGFGGPVQWFLGHSMWTIPARLSYAMYLVHYQIMFVVVGSFSAPFAFSNPAMLDRYISDLGLTIIASVILYVVVEAPFADLCNMLIAKISGQRRKDENTLTPKNEDYSPSTVDGVKDK